MEHPTFLKAFLLVRTELAKRDRIEQRSLAPEADSGDDEEEKDPEDYTKVSENYILVLQWLWAASKNDTMVRPFPISPSNMKIAREWSENVLENIFLRKQPHQIQCTAVTAAVLIQKCAKH